MKRLGFYAPGFLALTVAVLLGREIALSPPPAAASAEESELFPWVRGLYTPEEGDLGYEEIVPILLAAAERYLGLQPEEIYASEAAFAGKELGVGSPYWGAKIYTKGGEAFALQLDGRSGELQRWLLDTTIAMPPYAETLPNTEESRAECAALALKYARETSLWKGGDADFEPTVVEHSVRAGDVAGKPFPQSMDEAVFIRARTVQFWAQDGEQKKAIALTVVL
ncbi:MAG: hypothetical protein LBU47_03920 [Christensenellaceae bacterium]|jgi:hypothetical protein|nr:hypothetical protein [Christensenellaceae bacterium]